MSQYIKTNWKKGDTISSERMNKIENELERLSDSVVTVDSSLSVSGAAADAKVTSDAIAVKANTDTIAPLFDATQAYAVNDCVIKDAVLYRFTVAHAAGAWIGTDAKEITVGEELTGLKADISDIEDVIGGQNVVSIIPILR